MSMKRFCVSCYRFNFRFSLLLLVYLHLATCQEKEGASASEPRVTSYIIGEEAPEGRFPYICSLSRREDGIHRCGGTLIRPQWMVTAAHCVDPACPGSIGRNPLIRCGVHKLDADKPETAFSGVKSHWPESWTGDVRDGYDIAVVKLNKEANLMVPTTDTQGGEFRAGKLFTALGWGLDETGKNPTSLQMADSLVYVNHRKCKELLGDAVKNHSICAGFSDENENTCKGDSGGPLLIPNSFGVYTAEGKPEFDLLVGVTSMGSKNCNDALPAIYTSVGAFWNWILERIGEGPEEIEQQQSVEPPSVVEEDIETPKTESPTDEEERKEQLEKQKLEEERKQIRELSQEQLIKEAYRCIKDDDALRLEAAFLEGLDPDSFYKTFVQMPWGSEWDRLALLHWSAVYNASESTEVLLEYNATVDKLNSIKETPLHLAAGKGHAKVAKILLEHGADVKLELVDGWTALHLAARYADAEMVEILLEHGADVNLKLANGWTALHQAARYSDAEMVEILLEHGADVNLKLANGWTALHQAARYADAEMVEILLEHGADVNLKLADGWTALHLAARYSDAEMVEILLKHGADVDDETTYEQTPLHLAASGGNLEVVKLLIAENVFLDATDVDGDTPLHYAAEDGESETAKVLVDAGASKTITSDNGDTPFDVICTETDTKCSAAKRSSLKRLLRP